MKSGKNNVNDISCASPAAAQHKACAIMGGKGTVEIVYTLWLELCKITEFNKKGMVKNQNSDLLGGADYGWFSILLGITMFMQFLFFKWEKNPLRLFPRGLSPLWNGCLYGTQGCLLKIMPYTGPCSSQLTVLLLGEACHGDPFSFVPAHLCPRSYQPWPLTPRTQMLWG